MLKHPALLTTLIPAQPPANITVIPAQAGIHFDLDLSKLTTEPIDFKWFQVTAGRAAPG
ncbi:MAG: hypothetical protein V7751_18735 [Pseudoalteromonas distincta]